MLTFSSAGATRCHGTFYAVCAFCGNECSIGTGGSNRSATFKCEHGSCDGKDKEQYTRFHKDMQAGTKSR